MAEDEVMVAAMEQAGLNFIGPCSRTVRQAGLKDEAKRTALKAGVSVTPGIDNATALTLIKKHPTSDALLAVADANNLSVEEGDDDLEALADRSWRHSDACLDKKEARAPRRLSAFAHPLLCRGALDRRLRE